ncbi:GTPase IMAP family member 6-like [Alosa sapidissima]|uniref:GTPase IMAP family member 6-like n=1 Tax=Alosa sapidissima TaxID=34773 RepID=UPI001C0A358A|nr:GTPase IMAP family member 6-like [Alosa sapidissima]
MATCSKRRSGEDTQTLPEVRIVMLGFRDAGKSSAGNTILQGDMFDHRKTVESVKRQGKIAGKHVTVINTPGWGREQLLKDSPELIKENIILSMALCPPGPHTVLIVVRIDVKLTETNRRAMQEHVELLGERVWSHSMVLFTCGDWLGDTCIEKYIESEGKVMEWLVEKCGNRYHVINNVNKEDTSQVLELLEKVEEMVRRNNGQQYEIDRRRLVEIEQRKRSCEEKAKKRMMKGEQYKLNCPKDVGIFHKPKEGAIADLTGAPSLDLATEVPVPQLGADTEISALAVTEGTAARTPTSDNPETEHTRTSESVSTDRKDAAGPSLTSTDEENVATSPTPTSKTRGAVIRTCVASNDDRDSTGCSEVPLVPTRQSRNRRLPARYQNYHMS